MASLVITISRGNPSGYHWESFVTVWIICVLLGYAKRSYQSNGKMIYRILHCCKLHNPPPKISKMPSTKIIAERRKHKHTYFIENSESDKNTEVITFCPDVDPKWQSFFFFAVPITGTFFSGLAAFVDTKGILYKLIQPRV